MPLRAERKSTLIHVAIVEDDDNYAETIQEYLKKFGKVQQEQFLVSRFHDGYEIVDDYNKAQDIILMDIEMGLMDGMEAAEQIRKVDEQVIIIFITNMAQYALRGYKVNALDYVLKPISYASFTETLKKAVGDGRTMHAREALQKRLIDKIGTLSDALKIVQTDVKRRSRAR